MVTIKLLEYMYLFFVVAGAVAILILLYLRYLTNRAFKVMLRMVDANRDCNYDVTRFLPNVQGLVKVVEIDEVFYHITYGESTLSRPYTGKRQTVVREVSRPDYSIRLGIIPLSPRGYQKYIYMIIFEALFLLIEMDILMRIKVTNDAFINFSKLQAFLLHDVKNVTQFIRSLLFNINKIEGAEREHRFIESLRESTPALKVRTDKILGTLEVGVAKKGDEEDKQEIDIAGLIRELIDLHGIKGEVTGNGSFVEEKHLVVTVIDNIIKNIRDKASSEPGLRCFAAVHEKDEALQVTIGDTGSPVKEIERMFEPFYTTKGSGLGVGLFQARHIVKNLGGAMTVANTERGVEFTISFMKAGRMADPAGGVAA
ncbi:MAG: hypothetical protein KBB65_10330 [Syntrophorhabdaceae bacterium]|nr:hypothetical protein [Syntrophorhabdaceae bacterium]